MTTIAWDGKTLAADTLVTSGGVRVGQSVKAYRIGRLLVGVSGTVGLWQRFLAWLSSGAVGDPPDMAKDDADAEVVVIMPDGRIVTFDRAGRDHIMADRYALGSGGRLALAAMAAGVDSRRAVEIAATLDCYSGGEITTLSVR